MPSEATAEIDFAHYVSARNFEYVPTNDSLLIRLVVQYAAWFYTLDTRKSNSTCIMVAE